MFDGKSPYFEEKNNPNLSLKINHYDKEDCEFTDKDDYDEGWGGGGQHKT